MAKGRAEMTELIMGAIGGAVLTPLLRICWKLIEHAILGWSDDQIAEWLSQHFPLLVQNPISSVVAWGPPVAVAAICIGIAYWLGRGHRQPEQVKSTGARPAGKVGLRDPLEPTPACVATFQSAMRVALPVTLRAHLVVDLPAEMCLPRDNGSAHFRHEVVALIDTDNSSEAAGDMIEQSFNYRQCHADGRQA